MTVPIVIVVDSGQYVVSSVVVVVTTPGFVRVQGQAVMVNEVASVTVMVEPGPIGIVVGYGPYLISIWRQA